MRVDGIFVNATHGDQTKGDGRFDSGYVAVRVNDDEFAGSPKRNERVRAACLVN